jgi:cholesterol transport system auxiliary component
MYDRGTSMNRTQRLLCQISLASVILLAGCTALPTPHVDNTHQYLLDALPTLNTTSHKSPLVLAISQPTARPGFDTPQMAYLRQPLELEYFATHRWADTPSHMLKPLLAQALEPMFSAVVQAPVILPANLRLDSELIRLQQNFTSKPSRIQLTLRVQLVNIKDKQIIISKVFDESENVSSEDAYAGVIAANHALQRILDQLTDFLAHQTNIK